MLETAVRATNAQFEDKNVLERLDVKLLEASPGDCGWDVFSLAYHVDGPLSVVFSSNSMMKYLTSTTLGRWDAGRSLAAHACVCLSVLLENNFVF